MRLHRILFCILEMKAREIAPRRARTVEPYTSAKAMGKSLLAQHVVV